MKKLLTLLLAGMLMTGVLVGCGQSDDESSGQQSEGGPTNTPTEPRTDLTFAWFRGMESVSPHTTAGEMWFQEMVYETLVSIENSGIEPCLAETWDISPDGLTYTFHLREGVTFTDGTPFDANAVVKNFDNIHKDAASLKWLESIVLTESYRAVDDYTFELVLSNPYYPLLTELGLARPYGMGSTEIFIEGEPRSVTSAVGTGPYYLADEVANEYVVMEMNENYWGDKPQIETVTMKVIPDAQTRIMALEKGEIDLIYGLNVLDPATIKSYGDAENIHSKLSEPSATKHFVINSHIPGLDDPAVRYAISHAVNKEEIAEGIFYGIEEPAHTLFAENIPYCNVGLEPYNFDMELATKLLDDAGWIMGDDGIRAKDGVKLSFEAVYDNDTVTDKYIFEFLKSEFAPLGIELNLTGYERATYFDIQKSGNFDIVMGIPWGSPYDPHTSLASFRSPSYGDYQALSGLEGSEEIFAEITSFLAEVDEEVRAEKIKDVLTFIHEGAVHVPLVFESNKALYTDELKEITFAPSVYTFPFWDFK